MNLVLPVTERSLEESTRGLEEALLLWRHRAPHSILAVAVLLLSMRHSHVSELRSHRASTNAPAPVFNILSLKSGTQRPRHFISPSSLNQPHSRATYCNSLAPSRPEIRRCLRRSWTFITSACTADSLSWLTSAGRPDVAAIAVSFFARARMAPTFLG